MVDFEISRYLEFGCPDSKCFLSKATSALTWRLQRLNVVVVIFPTYVITVVMNIFSKENCIGKTISTTSFFLTHLL